MSKNQQGALSLTISPRYFLILATLFFLIPVMLLAQTPTLTIAESYLDNTIGIGNKTTLTITIDNSSGSLADMIDMTDALSANTTLASPLNLESSCDGVVTAVAGGSTIGLSGARLGTGSSCTVRVDVTSSVDGTHTNVLNGSSSLGVSTTTTSPLMVDASSAAQISMNLLPQKITPGGQSTISLIVVNPSAALLQISFNMALPAGITAAAIPNVTSSSTLINASLGVTGLSVFGTLTAGETAFFTLDVKAEQTGIFGFKTSSILSAGNPRGFASASLDIPRETLTMTFLDNPIIDGDQTDLEFTITNFSRSESISNISFSVDLASALTGLSAINLPLNDACGTGSSISGTGVVSFSGGSLASESSCTFTISVQVPDGAASGLYSVLSSAVSYDEGGNPVNGNVAGDNLSIIEAPKLTMEFTDDPTAPGDFVTIEYTIENTSLLTMSDINFEDFFAEVYLLEQTLATADFCGVGSMMTYTPLLDAGFSTVPPKLAISGASLAPESSCTFTAIMQVPLDAPDGVYPSETTVITAMLDGQTVTGLPSSDELAVLTAPIMSKSFDNEVVAPGDNLVMTFSIFHAEDALGDATGISFSDDLQGFIPDLTLVGSLPTDPCGTGSVVAIDGSNVLTLTGGNIPLGTDLCSFSITLQVPETATPGTQTNTTSEVSSVIGGFNVTGEPASAEILISPFSLELEFTGSPILPGGTAGLSYTLTNFSESPITNIIFTNSLNQVLSGLLKNAGPVVNTCSTGTIGGNASTIQATGFSLPAGAGQSCSVSISLDVPLSAVEGLSYPNVTSIVQGTFESIAVTAAPATGSLDIDVDDNSLSLTKSFSGEALPGEMVDLTFNIGFAGGSIQEVTNISFTDDLNTTLTGLTAVSISNNSCTGFTPGAFPTSLIAFSGQSLTSGGACSFTVQLLVPISAVSGEYLNTTSDITSTEVSGDPASATLSIGVVDHEPAQADAGPDQTVQCSGVGGTNVILDGSASSSIHPPIASYTWTEEGSTIATGATPTVSLTQGIHIITLTVVDAFDAAVDQVIITVVDTEDPMITCPDGTGISFDLSADANCEAVLPDYTTEATSIDNCDGSLTIVQTPLPGTILLGAGTMQLVTLTTMDGNGNGASCDFTVEVVDLTNPMITCPGNITQSAAAGECSAVVTWTDPVATDNCGTASVECSPPSGSSFIVGTTTVTCIATDGSGNTTMCTFDVIVTDDENPVITCPADIVVSNDAGLCEAVIDFSVTATDNCDGVSVSSLPASGSSFVVGTTLVSSTAQDASGNMTSCSFNVTVNDDEAPVIAIIGDNPLTVFRFSGPYIDPGATASDNCDVSPAVSTSNNVNTNLVGTYMVNYSTMDIAGNMTTALRIVSVIDDPTAVGHDYLLLANHNITAGQVQGLDGAMHANAAISLANGLGSSQGGPTIYDSELTAVSQISVGRNNVVNGDITAPLVSIGNNTVVNGTVLQASVTAQALPVLSFTAGGANTTLANGATLALAPGSYGALVVGNAATLQLSTGDYYFTSILIHDNAQIQVSIASGPVSINSTTQIIIQDDIAITISPGGDSESEYLKIQSLTDIFIGDGSKILGQIIAPNGQVNVADDVIFRGSICADYINIGKSEVLHHDALGSSPSIIFIPSPPTAEVNEIFVKPNPFVHTLGLTGRFDSLSKTGIIRIIDLANREVYMRKFDSNTYDFEINTSRWNAGMYFIIVSTDGVLQTTKILKTN